MFQNYKKERTYVYFTGDIISHKVWGTSVESNKEDIRKAYDLVHKIYKPYNVKVFPVIGNHEPHPVNQ